MTGQPPLWLLDVDGVLNAVCEHPPPGYERTRSDGWGIVYRPTLIDRIRELHVAGDVEVRWLTTWCDRAATILAPDLELPEFAVEGEGLHLTRPEPNGWWKSAAAQRLSDTHPGRPLIWTDDNLSHAEDRGEVDWLRERTAPTLAICPNWRTGITDKQMNQIEAFCRAHAPVAR